MFHLDNETGVPVMPDLPPTQSNEAKWFTEGGNGVSPSWPGSTWFNIIQAEMLNVLAAASITPDKENLSQLSEAIQHLITSGVPDLKDASLTQKGIVQLSHATNSNSEILAATPKAVSDLGALLLKISNNLSEIKDAGPAAVAQTLLNLGLGTAATKNVGTGKGQIPDISAWASGQGWRRTPDGYIEQWGVLQQNSNVTQKLTFPIPFTTAVHNICLTETTQSTATANISTWGFNQDSLTLTDVTLMCSKTNTGESLYWRALGE